MIKNLKQVIPLLILFLIGHNVYSQVDEKPYECFKYFKSKSEIRKFLFDQYRFKKSDFKEGETIADIGAGNGYVDILISVFVEDLTFYVQDVDTECCNETELRRVISYYSDILKKPINSQFHIVIGSSNDSNLPDIEFDKIMICSVLQYVSDPVSLLKQLHKKLRNDGKLYIVNLISKDQHNPNYVISSDIKFTIPTAKEIIQIAERANFKLVEINTDQKSLYKRFVFVK